MNLKFAVGHGTTKKFMVCICDGNELEYLRRSNLTATHSAINMKVVLLLIVICQWNNVFSVSISFSKEFYKIVLKVGEFMLWKLPYSVSPLTPSSCMKEARPQHNELFEFPSLFSFSEKRSDNDYTTSGLSLERKAI